MRKALFILCIAIVLVACQTKDNSPTNNEPKEETNNEVNNEEQNALENDTETEIEKVETNEEDNEAEENVENENDTENNASNEATNEANDDTEEELIALGEKIFQAQFDEDIDFLTSILSSGTKIKDNTFSFENVTYPHEQDFFTEETASDIEFRYTHENDETSYIVGFAAQDEVNEYSFVIDFEFIQEDGKWKMNDMDINK
ncbi:hypothetical protein [Pseudogracilibacillus sp. ICA-222130]|uniref:hypothetical protein n=1 Tax=Pseudogracilibacillus sp. ICA-222130 TaxID=3134655 RepID=UPI0030C2139A